jgi:hypothetical protein
MELVSLTLGLQQATVAAGDGEAVRPKLGVEVGKLWCSSGKDEGTNGGDGVQRSF